jgi:hypothetical protein
MSKTTRPESKHVQRLRAIALNYPEVEEGTSCNKLAFKARNKAFLFVGMDDTSYNLMLKLSASLPDAVDLQANMPDRFSVGVHGWVTMKFGHDESPPPDLMEKWIDESFRLLAPKQLVAMLAESGSPREDSKGSGNKKAKRKNAAARKKIKSR